MKECWADPELSGSAGPGDRVVTKHVVTCRLEKAVLPCRKMNLEHILAVLISERDKLNRAIEALGNPVKRRGRPPKNPLAVLLTAPASPAAKKAGGLSPAKRKAQSERMKAYWAKRKKQAQKG